MSAIDFHVDSSDVFVMLLALENALGPESMRRFLEGVMVRRIQERAQARFASEGGDDAVDPWEQLHPVTVEMREWQGFPGEHPINRRTGEMERYITNNYGRSVAGVGMAEMTYPGNPPGNRELAKKVYTAQAGWVDAQGRTNPRPVLAWGSSDLVFAVNALEAWILARVQTVSVTI